MDIVHILLKNNELGKISKEQMAGEWEVWQTSLNDPSFAGFAQLCGGTGIEVSRVDQIGPALEAAFSISGPVIVEFMTDVSLV